MKNNRDDTKTIEAKRLEQIHYIMEHWDELPERFQGRFDGIVETTRDFLDKKWITQQNVEN